MKTINVYAQDDINEITMEIYKEKSRVLAEEIKDKDRVIERLESLMNTYKDSSDVNFACLVICCAAIIAYTIITLI